MWRHQLEALPGWQCLAPDLRGAGKNRRFPQRVRGAILSNTKAAADTAEAKRGRDAMAAQAQAAGVRALSAELVPKVVARATFQRRPDVANEVREMILRQPLAGIVGALRALRDRPDSTPFLRNISVPVLVIASDDDQIAPAAGMREMARAIPGAQFVLIPESGHLSPLEQPQAFNTALRAFL